MCPPFFIYFLLKISPPDKNLRPTFKFLILGIFYHTICFSSKNLVYKKFYYKNSKKILKKKKKKKFFFLKKKEKLKRLWTKLIFFFF